MIAETKNGDIDSIAVYVMTHGPKCLTIDNYCIPLEIGAACRNTHSFSLRDDIGDNNISIKDRLYCELTGLYWIWKYDNHKYTGLYHYRRIFQLHKLEIITIFNEYDWIVPTPIYFTSKWRFLKLNSIKHQYCSCHIKSDWKILLKSLKNMYPEYYKTSKKVFKMNILYPCNMFISSHENLNTYCSWLFPLLFEIEQKININDGRTDYNKRTIGFMSERLFTLYLLHNHFKLKEVPIYENTSP